MSPWYAVRCARCGQEKYPTAPTHPGPSWVCHLCTVTGGPSEASLTRRRANIKQVNLARAAAASARATRGAE